MKVTATIRGFSNAETFAETKWNCESLPTRISKSQEIILGNLGSDSKIWASSNKYSTLESLIERCFVEQETGLASSYSITIAKYWYFDNLKTQLALL